MSDVGLRRKQNQDSFFVTYNLHNDFMAVVCDGIGGGKAGDVASKLASDYLRNAFLKTDKFENDEQVIQWLNQEISAANDLIFTQSSSSFSKKGMGTTLTGVLISEYATYIYNIGDSRTYGLYDDLICLTTDHNLMTDLITSGELSAEEALRHPKGSMLTNALGIWNEVKIDIVKAKEDYSSLLICSDGLHGYVNKKAIKEIMLSSFDVQSKVIALVELSKEAGGYDNVSVVLIEKE